MCRCLKRLEWEKQKEALDKASADKAEAERLAMQAIDWCACRQTSTPRVMKPSPGMSDQQQMLLLNTGNSAEAVD